MCKDFMDTQVRKMSFRLTILSFMLNANSLVSGMFFGISRSEFVSFLAIISSVIIPIVTLGFIMFGESKKTVRDFLETSV